MSNSKHQPNGTDRAISNVLVALAVGLVVGSKAGVEGFIFGALVGAVAHEAFDAPAANFVAELTH